MDYLRHFLSAFGNNQCHMPPPQLGKITRIGAEVESRTAAGLVLKLPILHGQSGSVSNSQRHVVTPPGDGSMGTLIVLVWNIEGSR